MRRRVALVRNTQLINLVEQEHGILGAGLLHSLDDPARHGTDIGTAVATDVGLIADAAQGPRMYFRPSDRAIDLAIDVLPTPGGPTKSSIGPLAMARALASRESVIARSSSFGPPREGVAVSLSALSFSAEHSPTFPPRRPVAWRSWHGQELEDPVLDVLQTMVVFIQDLGRTIEIELIIGTDVPGKLRDPVKVGPDDLGFHRFASGTFQPAELALDLNPCLLGQFELAQLLSKFGDLAILVTLAQFFLDRLELLSKKHLALPFTQLFLDL